MFLDNGITSVIGRFPNMKITIAIPDPIFIAAEKLVKQLGISHNELFSRAIVAYIEEDHQEGVTDILNTIYAEETSDLDPVAQQLQLVSLLVGEW